MVDTKEPLQIMSMKLEEVLPDPPQGPLKEFREKGTFDWRKLKTLIETEEIIRYKYYLWALMRNDPLFEHPDHSLNIDQLKHLTNKRMFAWLAKNLIPDPKISVNPRTINSYIEVVQSYEGSLSVKLGAIGLFTEPIMGLGTDEQFEKYARPVLNCEQIACFALTEIAHGSNARNMRTIATFQPDTKDFVFHTPDFEAAKCWSGNMGKSANIAVVFAQLISKGQRHGLHAFVVPIRCPRSHRPFPGVIIGDLGEKNGLNGIDNGFVMFDNYRVSFDSQLARLGGVNTEGDYVHTLSDPSRRFGQTFRVLSSGRVNIGGNSAMYLQSGVVIATRYAAIRKQFSNASDSTEETPIIEYQSVQTRIMPYLAATFVMKLFNTWFSIENHKMTQKEVAHSLAELGVEIHALSSVTKPVCSWISRDGLIVCREICAGHGYLKSAGIGDIRNNNDANCTAEGENSVLIQQTINWLISIWSKRSNPKTFDTPLRTIYYLKDADRILQQKFNLKSVDEATDIEIILEAYKFLVTYMLKCTSQKIDTLKKNTKDSLKARNESQSYYGIPMAFAFVEHCMLDRTLRIVTEMVPSNETRVLLDLLSLFGAWLLEKHMGTLYMGGYWSNGKNGYYLREGILSLCKKVSTEAVLLADVIAPPDFILNSVLGASDGQMYKNLQKAVFTAPGAISRPDWWQDIVNWKAYVPTKL